MQCLDLRGTQVTDAGLAHLRELTTLDLLLLRNTEVSDAGVAELRRALPHTSVYTVYVYK